MGAATAGWRAKKRAVDRGSSYERLMFQFVRSRIKSRFTRRQNATIYQRIPLGEAIIPSLIDLSSTYSRVTTLVSQPQSLNRGGILLLVQRFVLEMCFIFIFIYVFYIYIYINKKFKFYIYIYIN